METNHTKYTDVHTEHCCVYHGCKYSNKDCTVELKLKKQSFPCELCELALRAGCDIQSLRQVLETLESLKHVEKDEEGFTKTVEYIKELLEEYEEDAERWMKHD